MKAIITLLLLMETVLCFSQINTTIKNPTKDSGKNEYKIQTKKDTSDYSLAYRILKNQVELDPENAELRYFLGYTIDKLNSEDARGISKHNSELTIKASEQFEAVIRLEPFYKGEILILDPYAKISAIWGSLAQAYLNSSQIDSAIWAFSEGKKRGGFTEPFLEFNRKLINSCDKDAILITYGDNITFPISYLQTIENYRLDVTVADANLLNLNWYVKYIKNERKLNMSMTDAMIDSIEYQNWVTQTISITNPNDENKSFNWTLPPTYLGNYILKADRILLDILKQNFYTRPVYFTNYSDSTYNLYLTPYLKDEGLVNRVTTDIFDELNCNYPIPVNLSQYNIDELKREDILKSQDAINTLNGFRWVYLNNIHRFLLCENFSEAKKLMVLTENKFDKEKLPFPSEDYESYYIMIMKEVNNN